MERFKFKQCFYFCTTKYILFLTLVVFNGNKPQIYEFGIDVSNTYFENYLEIMYYYFTLN